MRSRLRNGIVGLGLLAMVGSPFLAEAATAQATERYRVMVTNLKPIDDANKRFGRDLAKELRDLINELATHQPVDEDDVRDASKRYDIEYDELDCVQSLQLANMVGARAVFCGEVIENRDDRTFSLRGVQIAAPGGVSFPIPDKTWGRDDPEMAAQEIAQAFEAYVDQSRRASFCGEDFESQNWDGAENNCTAVLEANPDHIQVRFIWANVLKETDRLEEAYTETRKVMEADPLHEQALQLAGFLAATLGMDDEARQHYNDYLVLNPGNAQVRMRIAYELAQAGDPEGAMLLTEEGLAIEADNVDLLLLHAGFATGAAQDRMSAVAPGSPLTAEAAELYRKAQQSYATAYAERGDEIEFGHLRNMIAIFNELGQVEEAVEMAEQVLQTHDGEATLWSLYADLLKDVGRVDEAISALGEAGTRDPNTRDVEFRQGNWLVEMGRADEALPYLQQAVESGGRSADDAARIFFAEAVNNGINADPPDFNRGLQLIGMAKSFADELSDGAAGEIDFWHAYALYQQSVEQEKPQNLQTAQLTLPKFQQAARLFALPNVAAYAAGRTPPINLQQFRDATQQYIEIQEAIIQRGR